MKENTGYYQPGICNIGAYEISKRRKEFLVSVILDLLLTGLIFNHHDSWWFWLLLFAVSSFTTLMYLQIRNRFCVKFGWFKQYNFKALGRKELVNDSDHIARDRKKALVIGWQTVMIGLIYTGLVYLLAQRFHF